MEKVLVTGREGDVGWNTVVELSEIGYV